MNGKKYEELARAIRGAKNIENKVDDMALMLLTMATNDLDCIYKQNKRLWIAIGVLFLQNLFSEQVSFSAIIGLLARIF